MSRNGIESWERKWVCQSWGWHNLAWSPASGKLTTSLVAMVTCSKLPSEDGSVISNESERLKPGRGSTALKVTAQQKPMKEETRRKDGESPETEKQAQDFHQSANKTPLPRAPTQQQSETLLINMHETDTADMIQRQTVGCCSHSHTHTHTHTHTQMWRKTI